MKEKRQKGTTRLVQYNNGLMCVATQVHRGRVTVPVSGPLSDDPNMAQELFRVHIRELPGRKLS